MVLAPNASTPSAEPYGARNSKSLAYGSRPRSRSAAFKCSSMKPGDIDRPRSDAESRSPIRPRIVAALRSDRARSSVNAHRSDSTDLRARPKSLFACLRSTHALWARRLTSSWNSFACISLPSNAAIALHVFWYNYGTIHGTLRTTPAMAAGLTRRVWTLEELISEAMAVADEPIPDPPKPPPRITPLPETPWQKPEQLGLFDGPTTAKVSPDARSHLRLIKGGLS